MNWQRFTKSAQRQTGNKSSPRVRYRPNLDVLEDRTLLSIIVFSVDPGSSSLSLNDTTVLGGPLTPQGPGSLVTTYGGMITADLDLDGNTINFFDAGTALNANFSGNWQPGVGGTPGVMDPANYGGQFAGIGLNYAAFRDLVMGAKTDAPVPLTPNGDGTYGCPSPTTIKFNDGNLDYDLGIAGHGRTQDFVAQQKPGSNQGADGLLTDNGDGTFTVTVNVNEKINWDEQGVVFQITGSITGTSSAGKSVSISSRQEINSGIALALVSGAHSRGNELFPNGLANPGLSAAVGLQGTVSDAGIPAKLSQVQDVQSATAQVAHQGSTAAIDAVFQDPLQNAILPF